MPTFAVLVSESSNRVYSDRAPDLLAAELAAIARQFSSEVTNIEVEDIGGVPYVCFTADDLSDRDRFILSNLSSTRALFERLDDAMQPISLDRLECFDRDLISIQRYLGKTNEKFTHMLVNLAIEASSSAHTRAAAGERVALLDPVAGRGSTLNRALAYDFDAMGIELNDGDVDQYKLFITTYLKDHRVKHALTSERIRKGDLSGSSLFEIMIRGQQRLRMARGSSTQAKGLSQGQRFDVIVGDLPYGVQHLAAGSKKRSRSPEELVADSAHQWHKVLRPGGSLALSWNLLTLSREALVECLEAARFSIVDHPRSFEHVVDRAITRDLMVATN